MEYLQQLLSQIQAVIEDERKMEEERAISGSLFNVFEVLRLQRNEVRLHSALIANFLNPNELHGLGSAFLRLFLEKVCRENILQDLSSVTVTVEYLIGPISKNGKEGGRIDILVEDQYSNALLIENKIDAEDQPNQLLRYNNFCKKKYKNYKLLYLTRLGTQPSDMSCGGEVFSYETISYRDDILSWIDDCITVSDAILPIRETLKQYSTNLKDILNIMSKTNENKVVELTTSGRNIESTLTIIENQYQICTKIRQDFLECLTAAAKGFGLICDIDDIEPLAELNKDCYIWFKDPSQSKNFGLFLGNEKIADGFYFGIESYSGKKLTKTKIKDLPQIWGTYNPSNKTPQNPYGYDYLWSKTGESWSGEWYRWDYCDTLRDMANGSIQAFIESNVFKPIVEEKLLKNLEDLLD